MPDDKTLILRALRLVRACPEGIEWVRDTEGTPKELWEKCEMGSWMIGLAARVCVEKEFVFSTCLRCATFANYFYSTPLPRYPNLGPPRVMMFCFANAVLHSFGDYADSAANCLIEAAHAINETTGCTNGLKLFADIVREHITWEMVEEGLLNLARNIGEVPYGMR